MCIKHKLPYLWKEGIIKHRKLFDLWLEGAEIQCWYNSGGEEDCWIDASETPCFDYHTAYRVKPKEEEKEEETVIQVYDLPIDVPLTVEITKNGIGIKTHGPWPYYLLSISGKDISVNDWWGWGTG